MLTVACVLRSGGDYNEEYVFRLRDSVLWYLRIPYRFVCLSDRKIPEKYLEHVPLKHNWPGWWSKIEVFRLKPPVLYLDLDTIVTGNLADIAVQADKPVLTVLDDFNAVAYGDKNIGIGSGLMGWGLSVRWLYDTFANDPKGWMDKCHKRGDQEYLRQNMNGSESWQKVLPGQVVSYKVHVQHQNTIPTNTRVICFHGDPRPHKVEWLKSLAH